MIDDTDDNYKLAARRQMRWVLVFLAVWIAMLAAGVAICKGESPQLKPGSRVTLTLVDGTQVTARVFRVATGDALIFPFGSEVEGWNLIGIGDPTPGPNPPVPPDPPVPPTPVPVGDIQVLIVYDPATVTSLPKTHPIASADVRAYLDKHCAKDGSKRPRWRCWPSDLTDTDKTPWADPFKAAKAEAAKAGKPWCMIFDSKGKQLASEILPDTEAAALALLAKWGGK